MDSGHIGLWTALVLALYVGAHAVEAPRSLRVREPPHLMALELAAIVVGAAWVARSAAGVYAPGAALCMALAVAATFSTLATALRWDDANDAWDAGYLLHPCCVASTAAVLGLLTCTFGRRRPQSPSGRSPGCGGPPSA